MKFRIAAKFMHVARLMVAVACLSLFTAQAHATLAQFDFNDLMEGVLSGQAGGANASGSVWQNDQMTTSFDVVAGDLMAPASTNFNLSQSGTPLSASNDGSAFGDGAIARVLDEPLTGSTIWFSFLGLADNADTRVGIGFNQTGSGSASPRVLLINDGLRFLAGGGVDTGTVGSGFAEATNLVVGRIDLNASGTDDRFRAWVNPNVASGLGTPLIDEVFGTLGDSITAVNIHSYNPDSGAVDLFTISDNPNAYMDVTGQTQLLSAEWISSGSGSWTTGSNWDVGTAPGGVATLFGGAINGNATVTLGGDQSVADLTFNSSRGYTLTGNQLSIGGDVVVAQGNHTIASTAEFSSRTTTLTVAGGSSLDITGASQVIGNGAATFVLDGAGDGSIGAIVDPDSNKNVIKRGAGTWTIGSGTAETGEFHLGDTIVEGGTLKVRANTIGGDVGELLSRSLIVSDGATLDTSEFSNYNMQVGQILSGGGTITTGSGTFSIFSDNIVTVGNNGPGTLNVDGNLTLVGVEGATPTGGFQFELSDSTTGDNDQIVVSGDLVSNAGGAGQRTGVSVIPTGSSLASGTYELIRFGGSLTGSASDFTVDQSLVTRFTQSITQDADSINLVVSGSNANLTWRGNINGAWNVNSTSNWRNGANSDTFFDLDNVNFDDSATSTDVMLQSAVNPATMTINNSTNDFTFSGDGSIAGAGSVVKSGSGRATFQTANTYRGTTTINGGVLHAAAVEGALGTSDGDTIVNNGGALDITGGSVAGETIRIQGAGPDGRGALIVDGFDALGGGTQQLSNVIQDGDAVIGAYFDGTDDEFTQNDYRWDLEFGNGVASSSWVGNGHDLTKRGRGATSILGVGNMNVANLNIEEGRLWLQGTSTPEGATVTIGNGTPLRDQYTGNARLSYFYSGATGPAPPEATHNFDVVLSGGAIDGGGAGSVPEMTINGTVLNNEVSGGDEIDNLINAGGQRLKFPQAISGTGDLQFGGGGVTELQANNTYTGRTLITGRVDLVGTGQLSSTPRIDVSGQLNSTGRADGMVTLANQTVSLNGDGSLVGNVDVASGATLIGGLAGSSVGRVDGNVVVSNGTLQVDGGRGASPGTGDAFVQGNQTIGGFRYVAFEAENYSAYVDRSAFDWVTEAATDETGAAASGGMALVAGGTQEGGFNAGNDDSALYSIVFDEAGTYTWYVRTAAPGGQNDSFFGPDGEPSTANPSVRPGASGGVDKSVLGARNVLIDAEGAGGITTDWDWVRSEPSVASNFVNFQEITVTQADVDNETVFSVEFEPRQIGATLDKMVFVATPEFTNLTDADLDAALEASTTEVSLGAAPFLSFEIDGDLTVESGGSMAFDIRSATDYDTLNVTGTSTLDGTLSLNLDDFTPNVNDSFTLLTSESLVDNGLQLGGPDGGAFSLSTLNDEVVVTFTGQTGGLVCDLDSDGDCDLADIDLLYNGNPTVDEINEWLGQASSASNPAKPTTDDEFVLGDVNLDGDVNSTDLGLLLNNFNETGPDWGGGDLNGDNVVNSSDLGLLLNNFNFTSSSSGVASVPEPNSIVMLVLGLLMLFRRVRSKSADERLWR